jgi:hypothetical protein
MIKEKSSRLRREKANLKFAHSIGRSINRDMQHPLAVIGRKESKGEPKLFWNVDIQCILSKYKA